jgi:hypothetical protein
MGANIQEKKRTQLPGRPASQLKMVGRACGAIDSSGPAY